MLEVSVTELRKNLRRIIAYVEAGNEVILTRRGKAVARLAPPIHESVEFSDLTGFRSSIHLRGEPMGETVIQERQR